VVIPTPPAMRRKASAVYLRATISASLRLLLAGQPTSWKQARSGSEIDVGEGHSDRYPSVGLGCKAMALAIVRPVPNLPVATIVTKNRVSRSGDDLTKTAPSE
jgi:hypothetical protein